MKYLTKMPLSGHQDGLHSEFLRVTESTVKFQYCLSIVSKPLRNPPGSFQNLLTSTTHVMFACLSLSSIPLKRRKESISSSKRKDLPLKTYLKK